MLTMKTILAILCSGLLAFALGYCGIGSDLRIVKDSGRTVDCFVNGNPCGMSLYAEYSIYARMLSSNSQDEIIRNKEQLSFLIQMQLGTIERIERKFGLEKQKVRELKSEICDIIERH